MDNQKLIDEYKNLSEYLINSTPDKHKNLQFLNNTMSQTLSEINKVLLDTSLIYSDKLKHIKELSINLSGISLTILGLVNEVESSNVKPLTNFRWSTTDYQLINFLDTLVNNYFSRIKRGMSILDSLDLFYFEYLQISSIHKDSFVDLSVYDFYKNQCISNLILDYDYWFEQSVQSMPNKLLVQDRLKESVSNNSVDPKSTNKIIKK